MKVYKYQHNGEYAEFTGVEDAFIDPLETKIAGKEIYMLPANATFEEPPAQDGFVAVWTGEQWELKEDNRGTEYWLSGDEYGTPARVWLSLGALPDGAILTAPEKTLEQLKAEKHNAAGAAFAAERDAIRFIEISDGNTYGFDCTNEDITNFFASWKAAEKSEKTPYKVWINETDKGMIVMELADFDTVFDAVRESQLAAYAWYGEIAAAIEAATTKEELESISLS